MPPFLLKYLPHLVALAGIVGGIWYFGHVRYTAGYDKSQAEVAAEVAKATAETARIEEERVKLSARIENELQPKLAKADADARDLARRLRIATRRSALPEAPGGPSGPDAPGGESTDLGSLEESHFAACAKDAERLNGWIEFYSSIE